VLLRRNCARLLPEEITLVDGCRVTTPLRSVWDIARRERRTDAVVAIDALARVGAFPPEALADMTSRPRRTPRYELVVDGRVVARFDLAHPDARLAIEYDGAGHDDRLDRRRDIRTGALGRQTIRLVSAGRGRSGCARGAERNPGAARRPAHNRQVALGVPRPPSAPRISRGGVQAEATSRPRTSEIAATDTAPSRSTRGASAVRSTTVDGTFSSVGPPSR
jgi:hypothetical protein